MKTFLQIFGSNCSFVLDGSNYALKVDGQLRSKTVSCDEDFFVKSKSTDKIYMDLPSSVFVMCFLIIFAIGKLVRNDGRPGAPFEAHVIIPGHYWISCYFIVSYLTFCYFCISECDFVCCSVLSFCKCPGLI